MSDSLLCVTCPEESRRRRRKAVSKDMAVKTQLQYSVVPLSGLTQNAQENGKGSGTRVTAASPCIRRCANDSRDMVSLPRPSVHDARQWTTAKLTGQRWLYLLLAARRQSFRFAAQRERCMFDLHRSTCQNHSDRHAVAVLSLI